MENLQAETAAKKLPGKKAKTHDELIGLIRNKGFIVDDEEAARDFLRKVNYSRLTAYFQPFRRKDGSYTPNIPFCRVQGIYEFDGKISAVLFECIGEIERYLRAQFAYFSGHKHGAFGYLEEDTFSKKHRQERFLEQVDECIAKNEKFLTTRFHDEEEDGRFPIWVTIEFFTMGTLSYFYGDLKRNDRKILAKEMYGTIPERLTSWLQCLIKLRNRCAHYSRLYDWSFALVPNMPPKITFTADRTLFTQIVTLKFLYPYPEKWNMDTLAKIETLIAEYREDISLERIGFPKNWKEILQNTARL